MVSMADKPVSRAPLSMGVEMEHKQADLATITHTRLVGVNQAVGTANTSAENDLLVAVQKLTHFAIHLLLLPTWCCLGFSHTLFELEAKRIIDDIFDGSRKNVLWTIKASTSMKC